MSEYSGPKTSVNDFDASRWRDFYANLFGIGVFKSGRVQGAAGGDLAVTNPSNLNVSVAIGAACVKGFLYATDASVSKTLGAADPSLPRIDTVVLSWSYASGAPTCVVAVVAGTPASSPVAPTLTQNDTTYQFPLADCRVNAAATTIASVTDRRVYAAATLGYSIGHSSGNIPIADGVVNSNLNADMVDGFHAGHSSGQVAVADGTLVTNLNADLLDGLNSGNGSGAIPISNGTSNTNLNADMVDGKHAGHSAGQVPISDGTVCTSLNADLLDGLNSTAFALYGSHNTAGQFTLSGGTALPGTLDANEVFFLLA